MKNIKSKLISIYVEALKEFKLPNQNIDGLSVIFSFWLDAIEYSIKKKSLFHLLQILIKKIYLI